MFTFTRRCAKLTTGMLMALALSFTLGLSVSAQTVTGTISGIVTDSAGALIPGAMVTVTNEQTNETRSGTSNSDGRFSFAALQPGVYTLRAERENFQTLERRGTVLSANENLALGEL